MPKWVGALRHYLTVADGLLLVLVVGSWAFPKGYRPWYRAILLVSIAYSAPRGSFFVYLTWTLTFVVAAALVLTLHVTEDFREES